MKKSSIELFCTRGILFFRFHASVTDTLEKHKVCILLDKIAVGREIDAMGELIM